MLETSKPSAKGRVPALVVVALVGMAILAGLTVHRLRSLRLGSSNAIVTPAKPLAWPVLELEPLTGEAKPLSQADLSGKVTLLNFWGTWCPPCRQEFPYMVAIGKQFGQRSDFQILLVSVGMAGPEQEQDLRSETTAFLASNNTPITTYCDPHGRTRRALDESIGLQGYPTTVVLDRQGIIRGYMVGFLPGHEVEVQRLVETLLAEKPAG